jgi:hypothetical protein
MRLLILNNVTADGTREPTFTVTAHLDNVVAGKESQASTFTCTWGKIVVSMILSSDGPADLNNVTTDETRE